MARKRILIAESHGFPQPALERLRDAADVVAADLDRPQLERAVADADILWVRLRHQIDAALLSLAPHLQVIATPTTGLTHIDLEAVENRGIELLCLRGETDFLREVRATAEHTIGLMLSLLRHIPAAVEHVCGGGWDRDAFQGGELYGKTVAVVGYGRLGRIVARYLAAFGCRVLVCDPHVQPRSVEAGVELVPLEEAIPLADVVTLHVNLTGSSRQFFGVRQFDSMKPGSSFLNTSRGELVDEEALLDALRSGRLAGAALDVLCEEHSTGMGWHALVQYAIGHRNLIITPHIGGCTVESMQKTELFLCQKLLDNLASGLHVGLSSAAT
jgi:D-3-phosphoglycerate dehydrogenase / 2-oxoglutarate reductase